MTKCNELKPGSLSLGQEAEQQIALLMFDTIKRSMRRACAIFEMTGCHPILAAVTVASVSVNVSNSWASEEDLTRSVETYRDRYAIVDAQGEPDKSNPYRKLVDDRGDGRKDLKGLRNFRAVLPGIIYRGGGNNIHRKPRRDNRNPLPPEGLASLCREGFDKAFYLYEKNYSTAVQKTDCTVRADIAPAAMTNTLEYLDRLPLSSSKGDAEVRSILELIYAKLKGLDNPRPIYVHCWNGWHASGMVSAMILQQFCGVTAEQAETYWVCNTDGNSEDKHYKGVRQRIRNFTPIAELQISDEIKERICPRLDAKGCPL